nr:universal stress protein [Leucobacter edaphi]
MGYVAPEGARLSRVTAAYSGTDSSVELVLGAAAIAAEAGAGFRIASFHTRPRSFVSANISLRAEDEVLAEWERLIRERTAGILDQIEGFRDLPASLETAVGSGDGWGSALRSIPWQESEVLVVGSSSLGPLARISLGSHAAKIVRSSPVPVVMVPRRASEEYAARADAKHGTDPRGFPRIEEARTRTPRPGLLDWTRSRDFG